MIGYLSGKIIFKKPTQLLLEVNGVGYIVNISINTFEKLTDEGEKISLFTYLAVKEDALVLYGFVTISEKEMFELLISVNGVGPKLAQSILSGISVEELKNALSMGNMSRIISVPGIGRKTAERIMIELRDKVERIEISDGGLSTKSFGVKDDAVAALIGLGYNQKTADKIIRTIIEKEPSISLEELVKKGLMNLNN